MPGAPKSPPENTGVTGLEPLQPDGVPITSYCDERKALHQRLTDGPMYTEVGALVGTLEYMSPEQTELNTLDVDTRADVYALGVLLYVLLTGSTPLDAKPSAA